MTFSIVLAFSYQLSWRQKVIGEACTIMAATRMRSIMNYQNGICCYDDTWEDTYYSQHGCTGKIVFAFEYVDV